MNQYSFRAMKHSDKVNIGHLNSVSRDINNSHFGYVVILVNRVATGNSAISIYRAILWLPHVAETKLLPAEFLPNTQDTHKNNTYFLTNCLDLFSL